MPTNKKNLLGEEKISDEKLDEQLAKLPDLKDLKEKILSDINQLGEKTPNLLPLDVSNNPEEENTEIYKYLSNLINQLGEKYLDGPMDEETPNLLPLDVSNNPEEENTKIYKDLSNLINQECEKYLNNSNNPEKKNINIYKVLSGFWLSIDKLKNDQNEDYKKNQEAYDAIYDYLSSHLNIYKDWSDLLLSIYNGIEGLKKNWGEDYKKNQEAYDAVYDYLSYKLLSTLYSKFEMLEGYLMYHLKLEKTQLDNSILKKLQVRLILFPQVAHDVREVLQPKKNGYRVFADALVYIFVMPEKPLLELNDKLCEQIKNFLDVREKNIPLIKECIQKNELSKYEKSRNLEESVEKLGSLNDLENNIFTNINQLGEKTENFLFFDDSNFTKEKNTKIYEDWSDLLLSIYENIYELTNNTDDLVYNLPGHILQNKFEMLEGYFMYHLNLEETQFNNSTLEKLKNRLTYFLKKTNELSEVLQQKTNGYVSLWRRTAYGVGMTENPFLSFNNKMQNILEYLIKVCEENNSIIDEKNHQNNTATSSNKALDLSKREQILKTESIKTDKLLLNTINKLLSTKKNKPNKPLNNHGLVNPPTYGSFDKKI